MEPTPPAQTSSQPRPGWWSRNWKWFVPTGCLTLIALGVAFALCIAFFVFGLMKSTDVYKDALARAKSNPAVIEALGSPIKDGMFVSGNTNVNGASGQADLSIPISGPKGSGTIYVAAIKSAGEWNYSKLVVEIAQTKRRIELDGGTEP